MSSSPNKIRLLLPDDPSNACISVSKSDSSHLSDFCGHGNGLRSPEGQQKVK